MGYKILIKASGTCSNNLFKFYREPGTSIDLEINTLDELTSIYNTLIDKYPREQVIPINKLKITLNTEIKEEDEQVDPEQEQKITNISVSIGENEIVTLTAEGTNLWETDVFNWTVICDGNTTYHLTSFGPTIELNEVQSSVYKSSNSATASITIGDGSRVFVIKE